MDPGTFRVAFFAGSIAFVAGLSLVGILARLLHWRGRRTMTPAERRVAWAAWIALLTGVGCFLFGVLVEADWLEVTREELPTARLPRGTRLRIVHLSDLHVSERSRALDALPGEVAALEPDLIVFTGDSLNSEEGLAVFREVFAALPAPMGRFAVRGNHDVWYWSQQPLFEGEVARELKGTEPVELPGLALCGAAYGNTGLLDECLAKARGRFRIVAYHTPDLVEELQADPPDLYLAGHTHGGQVRAPFYGALITYSKFDKKYEMGRYQVGPTTLYVNRGIGFEPHAPRVRFLCRPEIAVIDLIGTGD
jgi:predicted MPP superfamily phosphohydrolase